MKHKFTDDVNVNLDVEFNNTFSDLESLIDKITESAIVIIAVSTTAHILKHLIEK